jgi:hypothetical protein
MILYETAQRISLRIPEEDLDASDELYSSEALALMPLASDYPADERYPADWDGDRQSYPFFAFDDDDDEDLDDDDGFDDLDDDDFDDEFDGDEFDDDEFDGDEFDEEYEDDVEYDDFDE